VLVAALNIARGDFEIPVLDVLAVLVGGGDLLLSFGLGTPADRRRHRPRPRHARRPLPAALLLTAIGLRAVATASAGPIGFVALVVPQVCLRLVGAARPRCSRRRSTAPCSWSRPTSSRAPRCPSSCPSASSRRRSARPP